QQRAGESDDRVEWRAQFVANAGEEVVLGPAGLLELDVLLAQLLLDALAVSDVADGGGDDDALSAVDRRQRDLGRELGAVAATSGELHPSTHRARARVGDVPVTALGVQAADGLGDEQLDGLADQLVAGVAEQPLGLGVDEHDLATGVDPDDRVRRSLQQADRELIWPSGNDEYRPFYVALTVSSQSHTVRGRRQTMNVCGVVAFHDAP